MKKILQVIATFIIVVSIASVFIMWPQIEEWLFGPIDDIEITQAEPFSESYNECTKIINEFKEEDWDKSNFEDITISLESYFSENLLSSDEHQLLYNSLIDAYTTTLKNSIKSWSDDGCLSDSLFILVREEIQDLSDSSAKHKGYLNNELDLIKTYDFIKNNLYNDVLDLTNKEYNEQSVKSLNKKISKYKSNSYFKACRNIKSIIKESDKEIRNFELYVNDFNENIIYYNENYQTNLVCNNKHVYDDCQDYIDNYSKYYHDNNYLEEVVLESLDPIHPYVFDHNSDGEELSCYEYESYKFYYNELKTKKICD